MCKLLHSFFIHNLSSVPTFLESGLYINASQKIFFFLLKHQNASITESFLSEIMYFGENKNDSDCNFLNKMAYIFVSPRLNTFILNTINTINIEIIFK